jgi:hypothetical protein
MRWMAVVLVLGVALSAPVAVAGSRDVLFWAPNAAGSPEQAVETMTSFSRYLEKVAGWDADSTRVDYRNTVESGEEQLEQDAPGFLVVPMPIWLRHHEEQGWTPLLTLVTDSADAQRYTLYGPPGSSLASMEGAPIRGDSAYDPAFVRGLVLDGEELRYELEPTARPLSAVRKAAKGEEVLVLLDESQRQALDSLPSGVELSLLAESPWMPAGVLVATPGAAVKDIEALKAGLARGPGDDAEDGELLKTMKIQRFDPVHEDELAPLGRSYASARKEAGLDDSAG